MERLCSGLFLEIGRPVRFLKPHIPLASSVYRSPHAQGVLPKVISRQVGFSKPGSEKPWIGF